MTGKDVLFNAVWVLFGALVTVLMIQLFARGLRLDPTPFGAVESSDPILAGPYGPGAGDRFSANELHALNRHLEKLLAVLEEIRGRIGE